jgi:hypothetical protein
VPELPPAVHAVLPRGLPDLGAAVAAQDRPPDAVEEVDNVLVAARGAAGEPGPDWLWLLDGSALPGRGALRALLAALGASPPLPPPVLLASKVVDGVGAVVPGLVPWYRRGRTPLALEAFAHHLLPVRAARPASLLVRRAALAAAPPPPASLPSAAAGLALTAGLLCEADGFLVPASEAVARAVAPRASGALSDDPRQDLRAGAALLRAPAWEGIERLWLGGEIAGRAWDALRRRAA